MSKEAEYCDLVMKGGITSGIVYPSAVAELAKRYRFKNIGGTSAGAIAAAATAAAELGERKRLKGDDKPGGIAGLALVAAELRSPGFLFKLFQPVPKLRRAFKLIMSLVQAKGRTQAVLAILLGIVTIAPVEAVGSLILLLGGAWLIAGSGGVWAALLPALLIALVIGAIGAALRVGRSLTGHSLGMCPGNGQGDDPPSGLSEWLHQTLQTLSGETQRPLLFQDLWDAPLMPEEPGERAVSLEVITTSVSHHEPRSLPFDKGRFWFRAEELSALVPKDVVAWMVAQDTKPIVIDGLTYHVLPAGGQMPVVVAARMSLSFPLLISAVPLYEPDWGGKPIGAPAATEAGETNNASTDAPAEDRATKAPLVGFRRCWFSDGGISSNFPIHLFDAPLPRWPTFAIDLIYPKTVPGGAPAQVYLPDENNEGWQRRYEAIGEQAGLAGVASFLFGIIGTMQNWRDNLQSRAPGHRDRIVRVPLTAGEGGINLNMPEKVLDAIAAKGTIAGAKLVQKFDFNNHWWVRWRNLASASEKFVVSLSQAVDAPPTASYAAAHASATTGKATLRAYPFSAAQGLIARARLNSAVETGRQWAKEKPSLQDDAPQPAPELRIVPRF